MKEPNLFENIADNLNSIKDNHIKVHTSKVVNFVKVKVSNPIAKTYIALEHERSLPNTVLVECEYWKEWFMHGAESMVNIRKSHLRKFASLRD